MEWAYVSNAFGLGMLEAIFICLEGYLHMDFVCYCVRSSRMWISRIVSRFRSSLSLRHCCVMPCGVFYRLKYCFLRVCAPHLCFTVVVLVLIMD